MGKTYKERQAECGLKVGDKVKILRKVGEFEDGWGDVWAPTMSECVGETVVIGVTRENLGVWVKTDNYGAYFFPNFTLKKVEDEVTEKVEDEVTEKVEDEVTEKAKEPKSYKERQAECGLKVGDKVKILRKAADYEDGWGSDWPESADTWVGKTGEIIGYGEGGGFKVFLEEENDYWFFPYFILEKVEEKKLTSYSIFTIYDQGNDFFLIPATSKEETSESIILSEKSGGTWEFYKKHIIAIKTI